ncbi:1-phosphofructokinase [Desulfogranum japonicum]|uniref:1-phosphofructokinase n=1 Tax=Desulfogranum japonicum TaxID=231447 RepID=UPI0004269F73|nr:1-phosphofructokinase [Desulfogranum japonicum]
MKTISKLLTITLNPAIDLACTVPGLTLGQVNRVIDYQHDAGGKGVNIAALLRKFDLQVAATGFLGSDNQEIFETLFRNERIEDLFVRIPGSTRIGIKILDPKSHSTTDLNFPGLSPEQEHVEALIDVIRKQLQDTAAVIIAGSLPPGVEAGVVGKLVTMIKECGSRVFVDTSGEALTSAIEAKPTFIKPNIDELSEYLGRTVRSEREIFTEAEKLIRSGVETVVVSLGERGALFVEKEEAYYTTPPSIDVVSTVGAGDALVGSMAAGMMLNLSLRERAKMATAISAAVVTQAGPGLKSIGEARLLEQQVDIDNVTISGGANE